MTVGLGGFDQAGDDGAGLATAFASGKQPVLAANRDLPQRALGGIVVVTCWPIFGPIES